VHRIHDAVIRESLRELGDRRDDLVEPVPEALASMGRDGDVRDRGRIESDRADQLVPGFQIGLGVLAGELHGEGVDGGAAGEHDALGVDLLGDEARRGAGGGGEVQRGQRPDQPAVHLLRERRTHVVGAQSGLDVADRDLAIEACECGVQRRGGVALHECEIRAAVRQSLVHPLDQAGRQAR
jgi:hypothetical protein